MHCDCCAPHRQTFKSKLKEEWITLVPVMIFFFYYYFSWLGLLEKTMWLQHLSGLLAASVTVCHAIEKKGRPVLVHCSDGWDRTPQLVATAQLCLDPFYRTVEV